MRALSVRQPWAELILRGHKTIEVRSRRTNLRERVFIYAALNRIGPAEEARIAARFGIDASLIFAGGYSAGAIVAFDLDYGASTPATRIDGAFAIAGYTNEIATPGAAPMLDFHGSNDLLIPNALAQSACATAEHAHDRCAVETFVGLGHEIGYSRRFTILDRASTFLASLISTKYRIGTSTRTQS